MSFTVDRRIVEVPDPYGVGPEVIDMGWVLFAVVGLLYVGVLRYGADSRDSMDWRPVVGVPPRPLPYRDRRPSPWRDLCLLADHAVAWLRGSRTRLIRGG